IVGVMAHELSHVVLRHGTAQATKATPYEIGQVAGAIFGAIVGGTWGRVISQGTQFGLGAAFLRFSREFEHDADIEGSHIMARVEVPSSSFRTYDEGNLFRVSVPSNWREVPGNNTVTFAPDGAYGSSNGQSVFTHGVEIGVSRNETHNLQQATDELIQSLGQG